MRHANSLAAAYLFGCVLLISNGRAPNPQNVNAQLQQILDARIQNYEDWGDLTTMLDHLAQKYKMPMGVDLENLHAKLATGSVTAATGTVSDALTVIVSRQPGYGWAEADGVVNVTPQRTENSILDTRIAHFKVVNADPFKVYGAIAALPEVKNWLAQTHLTERTGFAGIVPVGRNGPALPRVSVDLKNVNLQTLLNTIIKSGFSFWLITRWGDKSQYLSISVG
jgi:hypothetical protein